MVTDKNKWHGKGMINTTVMIAWSIWEAKKKTALRTSTKLN